MAEYCTKKDATCFTNLPLLTVISQWLHENNDFYFDLNPKDVIFSVIFCYIAWKLVKFFFRILKSMMLPLLFMLGIFIILYTKQFSYSEGAGDFILNVVSNAVTLVTKVLETLTRLLFGDQVAR